MSVRKVTAGIAKSSKPDAVRVITIHRDSENREFQVRLYRDGGLYQPATYYTTDKNDAWDTFHAMLENAA